MSTKDSRTTVQEIKTKINSFVEKRDWDQFHSPKNLSMAIAVEASELMERFLWSTTDESLQVAKKDSDLRKIQAEVADVAIYLISLCNKMGIDLSDAIFRKIDENEKKYPASRVKGKAHKYTYYRKNKK